VLAATIHFANLRSRALDCLQRNSLEICMLHCVFAVWAQYALLPLDWPAIPKAGAVFVVTLAGGWAVAAAFRQLPRVGLAVGEGRSTAAPFSSGRHPVPVLTGSKATGQL
jgi:hypothetical protein